MEHHRGPDIKILAKGPSLAEYQEEGGEVWGLNQLGKTHNLTRLFVMDDLVYRMEKFDPGFPEWLKSYSGRLVTSKAYPEWRAEEYPIVEVCRHFGLPLGICMYSTVDYMLALAIYEGFSEIDLYGVDCNSRAHDHAKLSIATWIGVAMGRGIKVTSTPRSFSRYWTSTGTAYEQGLYGYVDKPRIETL